MRIVVVTTSFPRTEEDPSGHFVRSSAQALADDGHEVHVVAPGGWSLDPPRLLGDVIVHRAGGGPLFAWPGALARAREAPLRVLAAGPFAAGVAHRLLQIGPVDRAVAHWIIPCAWPLLLMRSGVPLDVFAHGADVRTLVRAPRPLREVVIGSLVERGAKFTFAAKAIEEALARSLSPELAEALARASHVQPPPIDVPDVAEESKALRASLELSESEILAVVVCRLIASKRVELAIEAARSVGPSVRLVVIGDGPERAALEALDQQRAGAVTFKGALPRREAIAWIGAADVLIHPSAIEAAPTVIREARALGVPVVACDSGDVASWAEADSGIAVVDPMASSIAAALMQKARDRSEAPTRGLQSSAS